MCIIFIFMPPLWLFCIMAGREQLIKNQLPEVCLIYGFQVGDFRIHPNAFIHRFLFFFVKCIILDTDLRIFLKSFIVVVIGQLWFCFCSVWIRDINKYLTILYKWRKKIP